MWTGVQGLSPEAKTYRSVSSWNGLRGGTSRSISIAAPLDPSNGASPTATVGRRLQRLAHDQDSQDVRTGDGSPSTPDNAAPRLPFAMARLARIRAI